MKLNVEGQLFFLKKINQEKDKKIAIKRIKIKNELRKKCNKIKRDKIAKIIINKQEKYKA